MRESALLYFTISAVFIALLARIAAKIYENSILRTGARVSLRQALKEV